MSTKFNLHNLALSICEGASIQAYSAHSEWEYAYEMGIYTIEPTNELKDITMVGYLKSDTLVMEYCNNEFVGNIEGDESDFHLVRAQWVNWSDFLNEFKSSIILGASTYEADVENNTSKVSYLVNEVMFDYAAMRRAIDWDVIDNERGKVYDNIRVGVSDHTHSVA